MILRVRLQALLAVLTNIVSDCKSEAPAKFGPHAPAAQLGMVAVLDAIKAEFDVEEFDAAKPTDAEVLRGAIETYCEQVCPVGQEPAGPGHDAACEACPLMPFSAKVLEAQLVGAMKQEGQRP